jgi:hypothetical protein
MPFEPVDGKILEFYCLEIFANNFPYINPNDMKTLRLDAPDYDDSNES